jgi:acyl carrier protein
MNDLQARLSKCFALVFPEFSEGQIRAATQKTVEGWDSVATVTIIALIEEEFGLEVEPEALEHLHSFDSTLAYLEKIQDSPQIGI